MKSDKMNSPALEVRILYAEGCGHTPGAVETVRSVASTMGLEFRLKMIRIDNPRQAWDLRFLGSPTVQVNGLDIDPSARSQDSFGFM